MADDSDYIFPDFAKRALKKQTESKSDSKVSSLWSSYFTDVYKSFVGLASKMNKALTSHCHKKGASQLMAETPGVSGLAQIFRTGWEVRGFHSIFDYIVGSTVMQHQAGKAMSGWTAKVGDTTVGGQPPTLLDVHTDCHLLQPFISHLFINDSKNQWSPIIRELLVASLFRHYDEFCDILRQEPDSRFECLENHLFVATIKEKLGYAGVSEATFEAWRKEVQTGFFNRNLPALAIQNWPRHLNDRTNPFHQVMMDPRCFVDHFNSLAAHYTSLHSQSCQQQSAIANLTSTVSNLQAQMQTQNELLGRLTALLQGNVCGAIVPISPSVSSGSPQRASELKQSVSNDTADFQECGEPASFVKRFSVSFKTLQNGCAIADRFIMFFRERAKEGYDKDMAIVQDNAERRKIRNDFGRLKKTVKQMLLFCDEYPGERPNDPRELAVWLESLNQAVQSAEVALREELYPQNPNKVMSQSALVAKEVSAAVKEFEEHRSLPSNTPDEVVQWFAGKEKASKKRKKCNS